MDANPLMADIHNAKARMPAILTREAHEAWLSGTHEDALATLKPYLSDLMVAYPVSTRVNTPKNNGPGLIEPIAV